MDELNLVTTQQAKDYCRINDNGVSSGNVDTVDKIMDTLITRASAFFISKISRPIIFARDLVEKRNGNGKDVMFASVTPINTISSVSVDGIMIPQRSSPHGFGWVFDDDALYLFGYYFCSGVQNVILSWNCGVTTSSRQGFSAQQALLELINVKWQQRKHPDILLEKATNFSTIRYRDSDITPSVQAAIDLLTNHVPIE